MVFQPEHGLNSFGRHPFLYVNEDRDMQQKQMDSIDSKKKTSEPLKA